MCWGVGVGIGVRVGVGGVIVGVGVLAGVGSVGAGGVGVGRARYRAPQVRILQKRKYDRPYLHSRILPVENGPFRLDSSGPSSYRQSSRSYSFYALPRCCWCEGVLLYCCMAGRKMVGSSVLRAFPAVNACFARDEPSSKRVGGVAL